MKLLILCCEGLDFKRLYNPRNNDLFYRSIMGQGCNFLNFRYNSPSPLSLDEITLPLKNIFKNNFYDLKKKIEINKDENFCLFHHFKIKQSKHHIVFQQQCQNIIDRLEESNKLEDTIIILIGNGLAKNSSSTIYDKVENVLMDKYVHSPLVIYSPKHNKSDIANSITFKSFVDFLDINNNSTIVDVVLKDHKFRCDNYSSVIVNEKYILAGLRGPMFQYYMYYNKIDYIVEHQECYDLNNDYNCTQNILRRDFLDKKILCLIKTYQDRLFKHLKEKKWI